MATVRTKGLGHVGGSDERTSRASVAYKDSVIVQKQLHDLQI
jgi:hypothetical protein